MSSQDDTSESSISWLTALCKQYLSEEESNQIHLQFQKDTFLRNRQVMWSGILQQTAHKWADDRKMQTLTTAMGPLKILDHPACLRKSKSEKAWSKYIKGASVLFAYYITKGEMVTVLSPPPPNRFHPLGGTNYQAIEEPILKGCHGNVPVDRIDIIHPLVTIAEDFCYQIWPVDSMWTNTYNSVIIPPQRWRQVKSRSLPKYETLPQNDGVRAQAPTSSILMRPTSEAVKKKSIKEAPSVKITQIAISTRNLKLSSSSSKQKNRVTTINVKKPQGKAMIELNPKATPKGSNKPKKKAKQKSKLIKAAQTVAEKRRDRLKRDTDPPTKSQPKASHVRAVHGSLASAQNLCLIVTLECSIKC